MKIPNYVPLTVAIVALGLAIIPFVMLPPGMEIPPMPAGDIQHDKFYVEAFVADMAREYHVDGDKYLEAITNAQVLSKYYPFVMDFETLKIIAHGEDASKVGQISTAMHESNLSVDEIKAELKGTGNVWVVYQWEDYESNTIKTKHSYLILVDNIILGSGYYE